MRAAPPAHPLRASCAIPQTDAWTITMLMRATGSVAGQSQPVFELSAHLSKKE